MQSHAAPLLGFLSSSEEQTQGKKDQKPCRRITAVSDGSDPQVKSATTWLTPTSQNCPLWHRISSECPKQWGFTHVPWESIHRKTNSSPHQKESPVLQLLMLLLFVLPVHPSSPRRAPGPHSAGSSANITMVPAPKS